MSHDLDRHHRYRLGGRAAAIELKRAGYDDIVIFERADDVGGVWRENTYPNGPVSTNWPGTVTEYIARTSRFNPADYEVAS